MLLRLEQGIPWFGYDFGDKQIPHEGRALEHSHISYTKGCYTPDKKLWSGVRSRGQVNRMAGACFGLRRVSRLPAELH